MKLLPGAATTLPSGGFSLLELLISLFILSISFMAVIPLLIASLGLNSATEMALVARSLATQKVEELAATPQSSISRLTGQGAAYVAPTEYLTATGSMTTSTDPQARYRRSWSITPVPVRDSAKCPVPLALSALVEYSIKGQTKSRSFTTIWSY